MNTRATLRLISGSRDRVELGETTIHDRKRNSWEIAIALAEHSISATSHPRGFTGGSLSINSPPTPDLLDKLISLELPLIIPITLNVSDLAVDKQNIYLFESTESVFQIDHVIGMDECVRGTYYDLIKDPTRLFAVEDRIWVKMTEDDVIKFQLTNDPNEHHKIIKTLVMSTSYVESLFPDYQQVFNKHKIPFVFKTEPE